MKQFINVLTFINLLVSPYMIFNSMTAFSISTSEYQEQARRMIQISKAVAEGTYTIKPFVPTLLPPAVGYRRRYCVPSMFVGILVDRYMFGARLFKSIDHCVRNLIIMIPKNFAFQKLKTVIFKNKKILNVTLIRSPYKLFSVSEGWNIGLKLFPNSAWFLICNYDVAFVRGQLNELSSLFWRDSELDVSGRPKVEMGLYNWQNLLPAGYNLFALTPAVIRRIGYFDENFFPAFYEDYDYDMRLEIAGVRRHCYMHINPWHGPIDYIRNISEYVSGTIHISEVFPKWKRLLEAANNKQYFTKKWGCSIHKKKIVDCNFRSPFNSTETVSFWLKNESRIELLRSSFLV